MAVVVPAADIVANYCHEKGWWPSPREASVPGTTKFAEDFGTVFKGPHAAELKKYVHDTMKQQENQLKGFEKVQDILIESRIDAQMAGFTEANECLTPTFKIRRPYLLKRYMAELKELYKVFTSFHFISFRSFIVFSPFALPFDTHWLAAVCACTDNRFMVNPISQMRNGLVNNKWTHTIPYLLCPFFRPYCVSFIMCRSLSSIECNSSTSWPSSVRPSVLECLHSIPRMVVIAEWYMSVERRYSERSYSLIVHPSVMLPLCPSLLSFIHTYDKPCTYMR
jgi:hypothetical protein